MSSSDIFTAFNISIYHMQKCAPKLKKKTSKYVQNGFHLTIVFKVYGVILNQKEHWKPRGCRYGNLPVAKSWHYDKNWRDFILA